MSNKPTKEGWYWYNDHVSGTVAAEVFKGSEYYGGKMIAYVPGYNFLPSLDELDGDWSVEPIQPPPWEVYTRDWANPNDPRASS